MNERKIIRIELEDINHQVVEVPQGAEIFTTAIYDNEHTLYALSDENVTATEDYQVSIYNTGDSLGIRGTGYRKEDFVGLVTTSSGLNLHVFAKKIQDNHWSLEDELEEMEHERRIQQERSED